MNETAGMQSFARSTDPATSHAAAEAVDTPKAADLVLAVIRAAGERGCTLDDLEDALPWKKVVSISPVPARLIEKGLVYARGDVRMGRSRRNQQVLRAVDLTLTQYPLPLNAPKQRTRQSRRVVSCTWTLDDGFGASIWNTDCGAAWSFMDDGPEENGCHYCHRCGGAVLIVRPNA